MIGHKASRFPDQFKKCGKGCGHFLSMDGKCWLDMQPCKIGDKCRNADLNPQEDD